MIVGLPALNYGGYSPEVSAYKTEASSGINWYTPTNFDSLYTQPKASKDMANWDGAINGGVSGASAGGSVGGGYGAAIGGVVGAVAGLFSKKQPAQAGSSSSPISGLMPSSGGGSGMPSLTDAFTLGLGSIGRSAPVTVTQTQSNNQNTSVNVSNVLGGQPFGGLNAETGGFDTLQLLGDVFAIRDAQAAQNAAAGGVVSGAGFTVQSAPTVSPLLILAVGGAAVVYLLTKKGK